MSSRDSNTKLLIIGFFIFVIAEIFFLINLSNPPSVMFDEVYYVSAARQFLSHGENENWSQPPLGKILISLGLAIWGDSPLGWRFMSTVFGALSLVGIFAWAQVLFRALRISIFVTMLTLFNGLLFVQSRIATLDVFMLTFVIFGMIPFSLAWLSTLPRLRLLLLSAAMMGFALSCKWAAGIPWMFCLLLIIYLAIRKKIHRVLGPAGFIAVTIVAYLLTYLPVIGMQHPYYAPSLKKTDKEISLDTRIKSVVPAPAKGEEWARRTYPKDFPFQDWSYKALELIPLQLKMFGAQLNVEDRRHPYRSEWWSWPLMLRPIWYYFDSKTDSGVVLLGNPLIMWGGLIAIALTAIIGLRRKDKVALFIAGLYLFLVFAWAIVPRKFGFYYYYYPAGMVLGLGTGYVFANSQQSKHRMFLAAGFITCLVIALFIYFYPAMSNSAGALGRMWLRGWV